MNESEEGNVACGFDATNSMNIHAAYLKYVNHLPSTLHYAHHLKPDLIAKFLKHLRVRIALLTSVHIAPVERFR